MPLRAWPDTVENLNTRVLPVEVAIAVAREVALSGGDRKGAGDTLLRILGGADVGLLIAEA